MSSRSFIFSKSYSLTCYTLPTNGKKGICQLLIFVKISGGGGFFLEIISYLCQQIYTYLKNRITILCT